MCVLPDTAGRVQCLNSATLNVCSCYKSMAQMDFPRAELVKQSERQMDRVVAWIAICYFILGLTIAAFG
jgi:hypothetical protein